MSRIGKQPIPVPAGVDVTIEDRASRLRAQGHPRTDGRRANQSGTQ